MKTWEENNVVLPSQCEYCGNIFGHPSEFCEHKDKHQYCLDCCNNEYLSTFDYPYGEV
jgi:hypothetical protein